jgi:transposase
MSKQVRTNNEALRGLAERMFVEEGMTAKAIGEAVGVTEQTVGRWRKGVGNNAIGWDEKRQHFLSAPHNIKKVLMTELNNLAQGQEATIDVKGLSDVSKVIAQLSDKVSTQIVFSVFREFDNWMAEQDPEVAVEFLEWHKLFLHHKATQEQ